MSEPFPITLLRCGVEFFPALIDAIRNAKHEVFLETYIFQDDTTGKAVATALADAAQRGVSTHLMIDGFGSKEYPDNQLASLKESGVQIRIYRPGFLNFRFLRTGLRRLHRKLAVIDRQLAFVGGINILHDFVDGNPMPRYDFAVAIRGTIAADVFDAAIRLWWLVSWSQLKRRGVRRLDRPPVLSSVNVPSPASATLILRDNLRNRRAIESEYLKAIWHATDRIIIANAYFLPGRKLLRSLLDAAARGVSVNLLLQGRVEYFMQHFASQHLYGELIGAGVNVYLYKPAHLHAKVAVIDSDWATIGSSNMDPFSLQLAREANIFVQDASFTELLANDLLSAIQLDSDKIVIEKWHCVPPYRKLLMRICYAMVRYTQRFATRRQ
jgi:cardiolipin synthase